MDRITRCGNMAICISRGHMDYGTPFGGMEVVGVSAMAPFDRAMVPFDRAMVVSYRFSIVTVALSVTIRPQFAIECLWHLNQQGIGHFWPKFPGVPTGVDPWFRSAESEHPRLTNTEIILEEFQPMWSQSTNVTDRQTDRRTDGQTTWDRKTMLHPKLHCMVKINAVKKLMNIDKFYKVGVPIFI